MTNIKSLRSELKNYDEIVDTTEALELVDELENELINQEEKIKELENEIEELEDSREEVELESIDLGLDVIEFRFEKGNLKIREQFNAMMQHLNKIPGALI